MLFENHPEIQKFGLALGFYAHFLNDIIILQLR